MPSEGCVITQRQCVVNVEVLQCSKSDISSEQISRLVTEFLRDKIAQGFAVTFVDNFINTSLADHVASIRLSEEDIENVNLSSCVYRIHVFKLNTDGPSEEELEGEDLKASIAWMLPSVDFDGLWESLIFDSDVKTRLLNYIQTAFYFSEKNINPNIITWNKVILLHGPPGTGKTSLCKALAQKLSIRYAQKYSYAHLVEINSHSLFSKYFSESGKLVARMFGKITELVECPDSLVFILVDEVESLAHSREHSIGKSEPSDAIRVVNSVLTQIDKIKRYPNVLILATSNITGTIDIAFVDRADMKQYIGFPSAKAVFAIYKSCLEELNSKFLVYVTDLSAANIQLQSIANKSVGLSARSLRKLPFLAYSLCDHGDRVSGTQFLDALSVAVDREKEERKHLSMDIDSNVNGNGTVK